MKMKCRWMVVFGLATLTFICAIRSGDDYFEIARNLQIFADVYREVNLKFVDPVKPGQVIKTGIDAMLESLDPYTVYIPKSGLEDFRMKYINPQYGGIGALVFQKNDQIIVQGVYENFPAQLADVRAGDRIVRFGNLEVNVRNAAQVSDMLKGQKGTSVNLTLSRPGEKELITKRIGRQEIKVKNVSFSGVIGETGYLKLDHFLENSYAEVKNSLVQLKAARIKALILDLRGNGGGILQESVKIANLFIEKGNTIVTQSGKGGQNQAVYAANSQPLDAHIPLAILIDSGTASASEIVAGAVQDLERGVLVGGRSFGKGLVQQTTPLSYNTLIKVTIARYYTPSGRCIQAVNYLRPTSDGRQLDSLAQFKTKGGRLVYDRSGIYPDVYMKPQPAASIVTALLYKSLIFDYATLFRNTHGTIDSPEHFHLPEGEYVKFTNYLSGKDYTYSSRTEKAIAGLRSVAINEKRLGALTPELDALKAKLENEKKDDLSVYKNDIKAALESEIVERYYYQKGRVRYDLKQDQEVLKAIDLLHKPDLYHQILSGKGRFNVIGKPAMRLDLKPAIKANETKDSLLRDAQK